MENTSEINLSLGLSLSGNSVASLKHPERNEDSIYYNAFKGLAMVFDGVGGVVGGEIASKTARDYLVDYLDYQLGKSKVGIDGTKTIIGNALRAASDEVLMRTKGAGTTAVVAKFMKVEDETRAIIGSVGDSRAYLFREGKLTLITNDDSLVFERYPLTRALALTEKLDQISSEGDLRTLSPEEVNLYRQRNVITQMLGQDEYVQTHVYDLILRSGDRVILTTDGVHDNLSKAEMVILGARNKTNLANSLVSEAIARSKSKHFRSKPDDISALVAEISNSDPKLEVVKPAYRVKNQTYDLSGGLEVEIEFGGKPIKIDLAPKTERNALLELIAIRDIASQVRGIHGAPNTAIDRFIIDRALLVDTHYKVGFKALRDGETVILGRYNPGRFKFSRCISRSHLSIFRDHDTIVFKDLESTNGTIITVPA